jgi:cell wall-associated NlpC family hydrolase
MDLSQFVGIPWGQKGRSRDSCDCWGLAVMVHEAVGITLPSFADDYTTTADRTHNRTLIDRTKPAWLPIRQGAERELDVILMTEAGVPCHIGIVAGRGMVLHARPGLDSVIEPYTTGKLKARIAGFYRYRK